MIIQDESKPFDKSQVLPYFKNMKCSCGDGRGPGGGDAMVGDYPMMFIEKGLWHGPVSTPFNVSLPVAKCIHQKIVERSCEDEYWIRLLESGAKIICICTITGEPIQFEIERDGFKFTGPDAGIRQKQWDDCYIAEW